MNATVPADDSAELRTLSYAQAVREAMTLAMEADPTVILMGEDMGVYGGAFQVTLDLVDRFGPDRVMDTPISELGGAGVAVGAALTRLKPIFEFQFSDFAKLAMEHIVNQAAKLRYMLRGRSVGACGFSHAVRVRYKPGHGGVIAGRRAPPERGSHHDRGTFGGPDRTGARDRKPLWHSLGDCRPVCGSRRRPGQSDRSGCGQFPFGTDEVRDDRRRGLGPHAIQYTSVHFRRVA